MYDVTDTPRLPAVGSRAGLGGRLLSPYERRFKRHHGGAAGSRRLRLLAGEARLVPELLFVPASEVKCRPTSH